MRNWLGKLIFRLMDRFEKKIESDKFSRFISSESGLALVAGILVTIIYWGTAFVCNVLKLESFWDSIEQNC